MRKARIAGLALLSTVAAAVATLAIAIAVSGWTDTREQCNRSVVRAEVFLFARAPWLLRLVAPSANADEREVWRSLLQEFSRSPRGTPLRIGVDSATRWPELTREHAQYLYERIAEGSAYDPGDPRYAFAVHEFIVKNSKPAELLQSDIPSNVRLIPLAKFSADTEGREGWERFVTRNGVVAYVSFSRVGFTPRRDRTVVYLQL